MVRPLGSGGQHVLLNDAKMIRNCMERLNPIRPLHQVFSELLVVEKYILSDVPTNDENMKMDIFMKNCMNECPSIRPSVCFHHVVTNGPPQLQLPHRRHGWSHARYMVSMLSVCGLFVVFFDVWKTYIVSFSLPCVLLFLATV